MKKLLLLCLCFASVSITNAQPFASASIPDAQTFASITNPHTADKKSIIGLQSGESKYDLGNYVHETDVALNGFDDISFTTADIGFNRLTGSFMVEDTSSYADLPADDVVTLQGMVIDSKTQISVDADVDIFYNCDFIKEYSVRTLYGEFTAPLKNFGWYIVSVSAPGYLQTTDTLWVINEKRKTIYKVFYSAALEVGLHLTINNVYFNFGQTSLSQLSFPELDKEVKFFKENPSVVFEIAGHTDSDGPEDYNLILSQGRAQAVVNYLVSHGADRAQLIAQGYGESRPIDTRTIESGKAKNRRVEFTVLSMGSGVDK